MMRRREFITLLGSAAATWPLAARAQQPTMPVVGYLLSGAANNIYISVFRQGLKETGYVDGQNMSIEVGAAGEQIDRLPALAADLVRRRVNVILATGGPDVPRAAKMATSSIPIVFVTGGDPVKLGLVTNFNRPGGNITGIALLINSLGEKRLGLLRQLLPNAAAVGFIVNPNNLNAETDTKQAQAAAKALGLRLIVAKAGAESDFNQAFAALAQEHADGVLMSTDAFLSRHVNSIVALAGRHKLPAIYDRREYADAGGLMSYGTSVREGFRQGAIYTARILKGEKPAELPVLQPTKFEFVINLKTAKALGLKVSQDMLSIADEVIE
jgi:putative ABC transport system substrate-binding protein